MSARPQPNNGLSAVPTRILFLPGLGADGRMYDALIHALGDRGLGLRATHVRPDVPDRNLPFASYAERLFNRQEAWDRPFDIAIGCSFGGMLLQEWIGRGLLRPGMAVFISTATSGSQITRPFRIAAGLSQLIPLSLRRWTMRALAFMYPFLRRNLKSARTNADMIRNTDPALLFNAARTIPRWPGIKINNLSRTRQLWIHGDRDPVISIERLQRDVALDLIVEDGSHIEVLLRANRMAEVIAGRWRECQNEVRK